MLPELFDLLERYQQQSKQAAIATQQALPFPLLIWSFPHHTAQYSQSHFHLHSFLIDSHSLPNKQIL
jgi:hypothetical protein